MEIPEGTSSQRHVVVNVNLETRLHHILPCFGLISLVTSSSARIYRSYSNHEIPTVSFVIFVGFVAFLLYYCFELNQRIPPWKKSSKKHKLQIGIWLFLSALMVGFCFKFSKLTGSSASLSFLMVVTGANMLVLHLYSIWGDYNVRNRSVTTSRTKSVRVNERTSEMGRSESALVYERV
ncbi:uncharacterized protein LOC114761280 [Neltuma alba]|uniref:uncharacterized protein LOC114761280 n=1 Tax=Neltuma alba TaxID=207710 RepID=UPI0010A515D9|nr:uncharacterized protein LOC114761280 [Prosopis alba]